MVEGTDIWEENIWFLGDLSPGALARLAISKIMYELLEDDSEASQQIPWTWTMWGLKSILTRNPCCHCLSIAVLQSSKSTNLNILTSILV